MRNMLENFKASGQLDQFLNLCDVKKNCFVFWMMNRFVF